MTAASDLTNDLARIAKQEQLLQFTHFGPSAAWALGVRLKEKCEEKKVVVTIEVRFCGETVFFYAMPGTAPNNTDWVRRKRNTVELLHQSSYAVGLGLTQDGETLQSRSGLPQRGYASHGGSFPIRVVGSGCVGVVTISGLPEREDHKIVVEVLAEYLGFFLGDSQLQ